MDRALLVGWSYGVVVAANNIIELGRLSRERELGPVLDGITVPVRYVVASGTSFGSRSDEQERNRTGLEAVTARNANIDSVKVTGNHASILRKDAPAVAEAVREIAALGGPRRTTRQPASEQGLES
ncbi:hypothetical protein AB0D62_34290 [Streptomyces massasporeus]|uniref:hypothetical protein n=1 Tax=Streptomyces massasporeus TaxID=67324 RepID=UPI0033D3E8C2